MSEGGGMLGVIGRRTPGARIRQRRELVSLLSGGTEAVANTRFEGIGGNMSASSRRTKDSLALARGSVTRLWLHTYPSALRGNA